jgi:NADP-dependent 3-hydroxy acid dehydrogenase YdfG
METGNMTSPSSAGIALVTGAARRIGRHIALALARAGWDVAVHYNRSREEADTLVREIEALGRALAVQGELGDEAQVRSCCPRPRRWAASPAWSTTPRCSITMTPPASATTACCAT